MSKAIVYQATLTYVLYYQELKHLVARNNKPGLEYSHNKQ